MMVRSMCAAAALLCSMPAAALDVIASFTPVNSTTGNFAPVTALLTGLVEGDNRGSDIGFTVTASPIPGMLGGGYTAFFGPGGTDIALTVTAGVVTNADFYWKKGSLNFFISTTGTYVPQVFDELTPEYADNFDYDTFTSAPTSFTTVPTGAVPEPASWAMLIAGFGLVGAMQRRRTAVAA